MPPNPSPTPTPWEVAGNETDIISGTKHIATIEADTRGRGDSWLPSPGEAIANAAHIVRCVNAAPQAIDALELAIHVRGTSEDTPEVLAKMEAALAALKGETL